MKISNKCRLPAFLSVFLLTSFVLEAQAQSLTVESPGGNIVTEFWIEEGNAHYRVLHEGSEIIEESRLGLVRRDMDFSKNLELKVATPPAEIEQQYTLAKGKRMHRTYRANQRTVRLLNEWGHPFEIEFQVADEGIAFRYHFPGGTDTERKISNEQTSFNFPSSATAWLEPLENVNTGFARSNPSYEMYYEKEISVGIEAPYEAGWAFPALFRSGESWILITETGLTDNYSGTRLQQGSPEGEYSIGFPQQGETTADGVLYPHSKLPWTTPWRVLTIGTLQTIIESTHATDLAAPAVEGDYSFVRPGHASWSWAILKDNSVNYDTQKEFIDYAAGMNWEYTLVDVNWDTNIGYERIAELAEYASGKGVGLFLWYNSAGSWNETPYHPRDRLLTHESRVKEFRRLRDMGIKGIKVDFFAGDGQSMMQYYQDLFRDAAQFGLMVNTHGSTIPRGWHRTYPNLMTMEAVKGFEFLTFEQSNAEHGASTAAMLPFTRNATDPMDFTPMVFSEIPDIDRVTRNGLELAESVIFLSALQHFAEIPEGMYETPAYVRAFLRELPVVWEDTKFITGHPAKEIVLARKGEDRWYIAGLNGENESKTLTLDLSFLPDDARLQMVTGGSDKFSFAQDSISVPTDGIIQVEVAGNDGFVMTEN